MRGRAFFFFASVATAATSCGLFFDADALRQGTPPEGLDGAMGGDAAAPDAADAANAANHESGSATDCPAGRGPTMVRIGADTASTFCIDSTEVTTADYAKFLAAAPSDDNAPKACAWNKEHLPVNFSFDGGPDYPALGVNWCDAWAFCKWSGKRLCGSIDRTSLAVSQVGDPARSEWQRVCSRDGSRTYPYADTYQPHVCNYENPETETNPLPVASKTGCEGGYEGVFDMVGNVQEWVDACDADVGPEDHCIAMGGYYEGVGGGTCGRSLLRNPRRETRGMGIRCCAP